ncbi:MAG: YcgL domain-containing protein [Pseudomonadota bacterium]
MSDPGIPASNAESASTSGVTLCEVFRSPRREGLYLYVKREDGLDRVPPALLDHFGQPESALVFRLTTERRLARANAAEVLDALESPGYYLQMPPAHVDGDSDPDPNAHENREEKC